jgi:DNA-binding response OmpR family regulator
MSDDLQVLIVEDEPLVSMHLADIVEDTLPAAVVVSASVAATKKLLHNPFHFAILDIDVIDGKTYDIARQLGAWYMPYVFVSAALKDDLPSDLANAPFIRKPFRDTQIEAAVRAADAHRKDVS